MTPQEALKLLTKLAKTSWGSYQDHALIPEATNVLNAIIVDDERRQEELASTRGVKKDD